MTNDIVVEFKEVRDLSGISCLSGSSGGGAFRVLVGHARIGGEVDPYLGPVPALERGIFSQILFWARAWHDHYHEFDSSESYVSLEALGQIAYDVGVQLGRGHVMHIASPLDSYLRQEMASLLTVRGPELRQVISAMTGFDSMRLDSTARGGRKVSGAI